MYRYQRIYSQIWHDEKIRQLSDDARWLFIYILTSPHSNALGLYVLPWQYIEADLGWDRKRLAKPFGELLAKRLINYHPQTCTLLVRNHLKHNPIENRNQAIACANLIDKLPRTPLINQLYELLKPLAKPFAEPLLERLRERLPERLPERYAKPETETETETEEETETETEYSAPLCGEQEGDGISGDRIDAHPPTADASADMRAAPEHPQEISVFRCKHFDITREYLNTLLADYPALTEEQLLLEIKKAADYATDNHGRFKRRANGQLKNPRLFLRNWLNRVVVPPNQARAPTPGQSRSERNIAVAQAWAEKKKREMSSDDRSGY